MMLPENRFVLRPVSRWQTT